MNTRPERKPARREVRERLLPAVAGSIALHALVVLWLVWLDYTKAPRIETPRQPVSMRLLALTPAPDTPDQTAVAAQRPDLESRTRADEAGQPIEHAIEPPVEPLPGSPPDPTAADRAKAPAQALDVDAPALRARLLDQIAGLPREADTRQAADSGGPGWPETGAPVPGLPGYRGWLAGHVGTVTPSSEQWRENDGSRNGRYVLSDGTVICTRRRAPTGDEFANPWKSTIVTLARICGRQRPEAPDLSDPRRLPPPSRSGD